MKQTIAVIILSLCIGPAFSDEIEPEDAIKYRKAVMTSVKGHNNAIKSIVTNKVPFSNRLNAHLDSLEQLFSELDYIFPDGSDFGKTNAKDTVWDNPEKFNKAIANAKQALETFRGIVNQGDNGKTAAAFKTFGKSSCGGCHKSFKKKKE